MFRLAVALYLMLVAAVGPAACCCTIVRVASRFAEKQPPAAPQQPAPASCCHGSRGQTPARTPARPATPDRRPDSPGCPCKQAGGCEVVGLPPTDEEAQQVSLRGALAELFCPAAHFSSRFATLTLAVPVFRDPAPPGSSVSTDDLLYAFHILRC